jgi:hypothetical protein
MSDFRNSLVMALIGTTWIVMYGIYLPDPEKTFAPWISFLVFPIVVGALAALGMTGEAVRRVLKSLVSILIAGLINFVKLGTETDAEGLGYVTLYLIAPIVPYISSVAVASLLLNRIKSAK